MPIVKGNRQIRSAPKRSSPRNPYSPMVHKHTNTQTNAFLFSKNSISIRMACHNMQPNRNEANYYGENPHSRSYTTTGQQIYCTNGSSKRARAPLLSPRLSFISNYYSMFCGGSTTHLRQSGVCSKVFTSSQCGE